VVPGITLPNFGGFTLPSYLAPAASTASDSNQSNSSAGGTSSQSGTSAGSTSGSSSSAPAGAPVTLFTPGSIAPSASASVLGAFTNLDNPNLAAGGTANSVLDAYSNDSGFFGSAPSQQSQLFTQIEQTAANRFNDAEKTIQGTYTEAANFVQQQTNQWINVKATIDGVNASIQTNQSSLTTIGNTLLSMRGTIADAADNDFSQQSAANQWNKQLASINLQANELGPSDNLIGSVDPVTGAPNVIQYNNTLGIGTSTLVGSNASAGYQIDASDGTVWIPDTVASTLQHYSSVGGELETQTVTSGNDTTTIPQAASYTKGIQLLSYDPTTNAISLSVTINPSDPPQTVTGTLQRSGLGLMPAWFYQGLSTQSGQKQAFADINTAEIQLTSVTATVSSAAQTVNTDQNNANNAVNQLSQKQSSAQATELKSLQNLQTQYQNQVQAMQTNLTALSNEQQNYIDAFASQIASDPLLSISV
jgi:hypothetical protein